MVAGRQRDATIQAEDRMGTYVQHGCGLCAPEGWLNFDASPTLRIQKIPLIGRALGWVRFPAGARYGDIRKGLPLPGGSADAVYCSHVLEHLALEDCRLALRQTFALLRPGGVFRLVLPDIRFEAESYLRSTDPSAAVRFMHLTMGRATRPRGFRETVRGWLGNSEHQWMWDFESLAVELTAAGFTSIRRAQFGDSDDPMFRLVEDPERWVNALGMQCAKP